MKEAAHREVAWRDGKRYLWLIGLVVPSLVFAAIGLFEWTGLGVFLWTGPIVVFGIVPVVDLLAGADSTNPPEEAVDALSKDRYYRWITYAYLPIQYAGFIWSFWLIATRGWPVVDRIGLAATVGCVSGIGINTAHELGHKRENIERWLAKVALAPTFYGHFYIEHNKGHHVRVATPEDPASSRIGESFYRFWPRTVTGSLRSAWRIERRRYQRGGSHPFRLGNDVINAWLMSLVLWAGLTVWLGVKVLPYLALQALIGFSLLEIVNYLEHYGMVRTKTGPGGTGRYERVTPSHSWNSNNIATNVLLYHLQRHSDHHAHPTRRYQCLRDFEESPVLPSGYTGMIMLALAPPLWRRVMDPKVVAHFDGDVRRANVQPGKLDKLLSRYPAATPTDERSAGEDVAPAPSKPAAEADAVSAARCPECGYTYEVAAGRETEGFAPGTPWSAIPNDWSCPDCGVRDKVDFVPAQAAESGVVAQAAESGAPVEPAYTAMNAS